MRGATLLAGVLLLAGLVSMLLSVGGKSSNCWDNYLTENQAILNCEGKNK